MPGVRQPRPRCHTPSARRRCAGVTVGGLLLALAAATPALAADPPPEAYDGGLFDYQARVGFWFNRQVFSVINGAEDWLRSFGLAQAQAAPAPAPPASVAVSVPVNRAAGTPGGVGNMLANLVNEPITAATNLVIGDVPAAWHAVRRFGINSTVGVLGWYDAAAERGLSPSVLDVGLALCSAGVGEGAYVVMPFVGPRTLRDAFPDIALTNLVLWSLTAAALGTGATLQTILIAEAIEVVAELTAVRQIDPNAKVSHFDDFEGVRAAYLTQRRERCADLRRERSAMIAGDLSTKSE